MISFTIGSINTCILPSFFTTLNMFSLYSSFNILDLFSIVYVKFFMNSVFLEFETSPLTGFPAVDWLDTTPWDRLDTTPWDPLLPWSVTVTGFFNRSLASPENKVQNHQHSKFWHSEVSYSKCWHASSYKLWHCQQQFQNEGSTLESWHTFPQEASTDQVRWS